MYENITDVPFFCSVGVVQIYLAYIFAVTFYYEVERSLCCSAFGTRMVCSFWPCLTPIGCTRLAHGENRVHIFGDLHQSGTVTHFWPFTAAKNWVCLFEIWRRMGAVVPFLAVHSSNNPKSSMLYCSTLCLLLMVVSCFCPCLQVPRESRRSDRDRDECLR